MYGLPQGLEEEKEFEDEHSSSDDLLDGEDSNNKDSDAPMDVEEEEDEVGILSNFLFNSFCTFIWFCSIP